MTAAAPTEHAPRRRGSGSTGRGGHGGDDLAKDVPKLLRQLLLDPVTDAQQLQLQGGGALDLADGIDDPAKEPERIGTEIDGEGVRRRPDPTPSRVNI